MRPIRESRTAESPAQPNRLCTIFIISDSMKSTHPVTIGWLIIILLVSSSAGLIDYRAQGQSQDGGLSLEGDSYLIRNEARAEGPVSFGLIQKIDSNTANVFMGLDAPGEAAARWRSPIQDFQGNGTGLLVEASGAYSSETTVVEREYTDEETHEDIWEEVTTRKDRATSDINVSGNGTFRNQLIGAYPGKGRWWKISDIAISGKNVTAQFKLNASGQNVKRVWSVIEEEEGEGAKA